MLTVLWPQATHCDRTAHKGMTSESHDKFDYDCRLGTNPGIEQLFCYQLQAVLPHPTEPASQVTFISMHCFTPFKQRLPIFTSVYLSTVTSLKPCFLLFHVPKAINQYIKSCQIYIYIAVITFRRKGKKLHHILKFSGLIYNLN